jgi:transcriptional regulator with XRE-family HTH domain
MGGMADEGTIGTKIKRARERKRWSQRELAAALRVDRKSVDNWENGRTYPRSSIGALEAVLGISFDGAPEPDVLAPRDPWEQAVLADADLPEHLRHQLILDSRAARSAYDAARSRERAARPRPV